MNGVNRRETGRRYGGGNARKGCQLTDASNNIRVEAQALAGKEWLHYTCKNERQTPIVDTCNTSNVPILSYNLNVPWREDVSGPTIAQMQSRRTARLTLD